MTTCGTIFLDFDDTLVDFSAFMVATARAIGDVMMHRLGGDSHQWSDEAIRIVTRLEREYEAIFVGHPLAGYRRWLTDVRRREAREALARVGLPQTEENLAITVDAFLRALLTVSAPASGAVELLRSLNGMPVAVHLASGQDSDHLLYALRGMGIREFSGYRFGPDLIDCAKEGPEYYERCFALSDAAPPRIVVDNQPEPLRWAMAAGAFAVHSNVVPTASEAAPAGVSGSISHLGQLPSLVQTILSDGRYPDHRPRG